MSLLAVDWGTSSLRAALLDAQGNPTSVRSTPRGILTVPPGGFPAVLRETCGDWLDAASLTLVSGMAGSRQGWREAPYCACPASASELAQHLLWLDPGRLAIVPGLCCEEDGAPDVMRGEEVQVFGTLDLLGCEDAVAVLPGTHSKWVRIAGGRVTGFSTFMTGEFYALLRTHSILARTMAADEGDIDESAFLAGIGHARRCGSLLHAAFSARTLALFERLAEASRPSYLSGLVIGEELRAQGAPAQVLVIGAPALAHRYELALSTLGCQTRTLGDEATWRGLWKLAQSLA